MWIATTAVSTKCLVSHHCIMGSSLGQVKYMVSNLSLTCTVSEGEVVWIEGVLDKVGVEVKGLGVKGVGVKRNKEIRQKYYFYERPL